MSHGIYIPSLEVGPIHDGQRIAVPSEKMLLFGEFRRSHNDLILSFDGKSIVVHDYFGAGKPVPLEAPTGKILDGETVARLASAHEAIGKIESTTGWVIVVHANGT